nr:NADH dehydrogenase subunit 2 [Acanthocinus griseus]
MLKFYKILFFITLILGSLITLSSYSWLSMWIGLEINLLSFIPLLKDSKNSFPAEAALKYFISQALASSILLFSIILMFNLNEFLFMKSPMSLILNSSLYMKIGAAPFHFWLPEVMEGLNWNNNLILLTWQKIAPMIILFYNLNTMMLTLLVIVISSMISGVMGLNQISLRKIMAYSSISHISWMLSSMLFNQILWIYYFMIYCIISFNIIYILNYYNIYYLKQMFNVMNINKNLKLTFMMNFFSLGGLPPFLGFLPKWLVINNLVNNHFYFLSLILILTTLITLFFYLRLTFSSILINFSETLVVQFNSMNNFIMVLNLISLMGLIFCSMIFNFV